MSRENPQRRSTYAVPWIKEAMKRALEWKGRAVRIPAHAAPTVQFVVLSLDINLPSRSSDGPSWASMLEDTRTPHDPDAEPETSEKFIRVMDHLGCFSPREIQVIRMRFGLEPFVPMSLETVGEMLGLTKGVVLGIEPEGDPATPAGIRRKRPGPGGLIQGLEVLSLMSPVRRILG